MASTEKQTQGTHDVTDPNNPDTWAQSDGPGQHHFGVTATRRDTGLVEPPPELTDEQLVDEYVKTASGLVDPARAGRARAGSMRAPGDVRQRTFADANVSGVEIGNTDVTTREVQDEELVSNQLTGLIDENSQYIKQAKQRAMELANARGSFGSSFAAGAAQRAAVEAALPIATADAQAYRDAATQNMNAQNEFALANLQRATQMDLAVLDANTRIDMANMDAELRTNMANLDALTQTNLANLDAQTRTSIANMQTQAALAMEGLRGKITFATQKRQFAHEVDQLLSKQSHDVRMFDLDADLRRQLQEAGFEHDFNMSELDQEELLEVNSLLHGYAMTEQQARLDAQRQTEHVNAFLTTQKMYIDWTTAMADVDMDANAAAAFKQQINAWYADQIGVLNELYPEQPPFTVESPGG